MSRTSEDSREYWQSRIEDLRNRCESCFESLTETGEFCSSQGCASRDQTKRRPRVVNYEGKIFKL